MATKNKSEKKYQPLENLYCSDYSGCCGISIFTGLDANPDPDEYWARSEPKEHNYSLNNDYDEREFFISYLDYLLEQDGKEDGLTIEEVFKEFTEKVERERNTRMVQIAYVKKREVDGEGDMPPEFQGMLEKDGWYTIDEFVNPNHGNLLCVMGKTYKDIPKRSRGYY